MNYIDETHGQPLLLLLLLCQLGWVGTLAPPTDTSG